MGGNFGAFTTLRPASAARALGCEYVIIGHCEERNFYNGHLRRGRREGPLGHEQDTQPGDPPRHGARAPVLYCIGEKSEEQSEWRSVLGKQLDEGLARRGQEPGRHRLRPVWSHRPGKTPAGKDYITMIARFVKERTGGLDVVYGGGLKTDNAEMLASIAEIDGGLIAPHPLQRRDRLVSRRVP